MNPGFLRSFIGNFLKRVEIYLCFLFEDLLVNSKGRSIKSCETFVIALNGIYYFENHLLNVNGQFENPCDKLEILFGLEG